MTRAVWQISSGPASRLHPEVFLKHDVALIAPGDAGPWAPERDDHEVEGGFVPRFASEVAVGDVFMLRTGIATIAAVGLVARDYLCVNGYHLAKSWDQAAGFTGVSDLLREAGLASVPETRVAVYVGNAWDPRPGRETPWIDLARQLAGDKGVEALGPAARTTPPGTEAIGRIFQAAGAPVLLLFDEVLNFLNRHRGMADSFHAFIQNLTVATTSTTHGATMISLPRSQVEMTDWDIEWQDRISKVVRRVAKDLIANDETEISEVVRRRLFQDLGSEKIRKNVAKAFGDWCFERRARLPAEWTAVDTTATEAKAREFLQRRFEACYPFHPATLSVFQRNWQAPPLIQLPAPVLRVGYFCQA